MTLLYVVPCGAKKLAHADQARHLYTSPHFRYTLRQVEQHAARTGGLVRILSALHGLVDPDQTINTYDLTMGEPGSIRPHELAIHLDRLTTTTNTVDQVHAFLPRAYLYRLETACTITGLPLVDHYASALGIGYQRAVLSALAKES